MPAKEVLSAACQELESGGLSLTTYKGRFHILLHAEEYQQVVDMAMYDMEKAPLVTLQGSRNLRLIVPGLAEKRPSLLRGDSLQARRAGVDDIHVGVVHYVNQLDVALNFSDTMLREHAPGTLYDIHFVLSRIMLQRRHQAVDFAAEELISTLLPRQATLPSAASLEESDCDVQWSRPNVNVEQRHAVRAILKRQPGQGPFIIFGPPGTGKTSTLAEAAFQVRARGRA